MGAMQSFKTTLTKTKSGLEAADLVVGGLTSIGGLQIDADEIEVTNFDSLGYKEYISGFKDAGEVSIEGILKNGTEFGTLLALQDAGTTEEWTITFVDGSTLVFDGYVKTFGTGDGGMSDAVTFSGAIRVSGKPVFTEAVVS